MAICVPNVAICVPNVAVWVPKVAVFCPKVAIFCTKVAILCTKVAIFCTKMSFFGPKGAKSWEFHTFFKVCVFYANSNTSFRLQSCDFRNVTCDPYTDNCPPIRPAVDCPPCASCPPPPPPCPPAAEYTACPTTGPQESTCMPCDSCCPPFVPTALPPPNQQIPPPPMGVPNCGNFELFLTKKNAFLDIKIAEAVQMARPKFHEAIWGAVVGLLLILLTIACCCSSARRKVLFRPETVKNSIFSRIFACVRKIIFWRRKNVWNFVFFTWFLHDFLEKLIQRYFDDQNRKNRERAMQRDRPNPSAPGQSVPSEETKNLLAPFRQENVSSLFLPKNQHFSFCDRSDI